MRRGVFSAAVFCLLCLMARPSYGVEKGLLAKAGLQALDEEVPAPDLTVAAPDGGRLTLGGLRGRVVVLHFWATWCAPCKDEFPLLQKLYDRYAQKGLVFLPIAVDAAITVEEAGAVARRYGASFPVYAAAGGSVPERYWGWGVPVTYFVDRRGAVAARAVGPRDWGADAVFRVIDRLLDGGAR